ncbi:FkbM family methyltransferase [Bradyrhizobium murdochi]|uniref:FkbM family methyltransferase n=1 Tax=Bradyrhizobium murdochi TaxID=1038859 RepID=UPI00040BE035|nr:FkbM family methyltransferase [Bradyrhizobium murdochi]
MIELFEPWRWRDAKHSYSQAGEDLIIDFVAKAMQIEEVTYLDIGAHHPSQFSNTYLFYRRGFQGVLVEPDPELMASIKRVRPRDVCIEAGVGVTSARVAQFFVMSTRTLNTFSEAEAKRYEAMGTQRIEKVLPVPLITFDDIFADRFLDKEPTLVSIDVEGLDFDVLSTLNLNKYRPAIICVETLQYSETREEVKDTRIAQLMSDNGYFAFGDTYINTIFVDLGRWKSGSKRS